MRYLLIVFLLLLSSGCADYVTFNEAQQLLPVGFWHGLWHDMILPISWFVSLFNDSTSIYAIYNNGGWYDFGFILGYGSLVKASLLTTEYILR